MTQPQHVEDRLDRWLDDRLSPVERGEVERHLAVCEDCRALRDGLLTTRRAMRAADAGGEAPAGLEDRIRIALDREDAAAEAAARPPSPARAWRGSWLLLAAALLVAAVGLVTWLRPAPTPGPVDAAFAEFASLTSDPRALAEISTTGPDELLRRWESAELGIDPRVLDLSAMGMELQGGAARALGDRPAALAVYESPNGPMACWMFRGAEDVLPPALEVHEERGFRFHLYSRDGVNLVVWREGEMLCALVVRGDRRWALDLAIAKAMASTAASAAGPIPVPVPVPVRV